MRLPDDTQRLAIIGRTGTGKTQAGAWHLSRKTFDKPWVILDYKGDKLLNNIKAKEMALSGMPGKKGLHIVHPIAEKDDDAVTDLLWRIWRKESIGVYLDEGYMVGQRNAAFRSLLTQGRSKNIPMIVLSQRPVWMDRFAFSEADFYQVFSLNDDSDVQRVGQFLHKGIDQSLTLPKYHSWYHDVAEDDYCLLKPVPSATNIKKVFRGLLGKHRSAI